MADSGVDSLVNKRKYEDQSPMPPSAPRRPTGFSSAPTLPDSVTTYNSVPSPLDEIQMAKQKAQEIASRLISGVDAKRARVENGASFDSADKGYTSLPSDAKPISASALSSIPVSYGSFQGSSKKIEIPSMRVGVIIGKGGETIKYLQVQSGAKIQVTRDMDADPNSSTRGVELVGTQEQVAKAEQLINDVLQEAEAGSSGPGTRRFTGQTGSEQFSMKVPNNKVGLVIGKGGETIKTMQAKSGARIQVIPLHPPPGDTSTERTVQIDGTSDQIEYAKQLVFEVISENRPRNPSMGGGYPQQGYQARPHSSYPPQQPGYGSMQSGGYNMSQASYGGYPPQPASGGYAASNWDPSAVPPSQQSTPGGGYDYYGQQPSSQTQQTPGGSAAPTDNTGYSYSQAGQGYSQDGYGGYHASANSGYGQPAAYDQQQQGYGSAPSYGTSASNPTQEGGHAQGGESTQAPALSQQGYQQVSPNPAAYPPPQTVSQAGYGSQVPPAQSGYGPGYGAPPAQKPATNPPSYGQPQQPLATSGAYGQPGYSSGYAQPDSGSQRYPPPSYGAAQGYGAPPYGQQGYGQAPAYNANYAGGGGYSQPQTYSSDGAAAGGGTYDAAPTPQAQQAGAPKASPKA